MDYKNMDTNVLVSIINTKLRDHYSSLDDLCEDLNIIKDDLNSKLNEFNYIYFEDINQFKQKG